MARAVYGCPVREPYPSDFAFSGTLGSHFLSQDIWTQEQAQRGTELWLTLSAVGGRFKMAQSFLGTKTRPEDAPSNLGKALRETSASPFSFLDSTFSYRTSAPDPP